MDNREIRVNISNSFLIKVYDCLSSIWGIFRKNKRLVYFTGDYKSFDEAKKKCIGYDSDEIFNKVKEATLMVKDNDGCYERDGVVFFEKSINYNLMMYLYRLAFERKTAISVLDWGGSLGSTYWQHREIFLNEKLINKWIVIEQERFVSFGAEALEDGLLKFERSEKALEILSHVDCVLLSAVMQYIENIEEVFEMIIDSGVKYIILERTPSTRKELFCVEIVKKPIYDASYALRIWSEEKIISFFNDKGYQLSDSWKSLVDSDTFVDSNRLLFKSYIFKKC